MNERLHALDRAAGRLARLLMIVALVGATIAVAFPVVVHGPGALIAWIARFGSALNHSTFEDYSRHLEVEIG